MLPGNVHNHTSAARVSHDAKMASEAAAIENIAVYARIRSSSQPAEASSDVSVVDGQPDKVRAKDLQFNLDHAFGSDAKQAEVFNVIGAPLVQRITDGYNACIIAYGQTGSGKTYTMLGPENAKLDGSGGETADLGIVPRACLQLFKMLPAGYTVTTSYMEVYNDNVNDLLTADYTNKEYLPLRETVPGHVEPDGITRRQVKSASDVMKAIALGDSRRVVAAMAMNPRSSRGHGLIAIETYTDKGTSHGRLCLVDLAGEILPCDCHMMET
jgi:Kinesin motor domain